MPDSSRFARPATSSIDTIYFASYKLSRETLATPTKVLNFNTDLNI